MVEGGGSKTFSRAKRWLFMYPDESRNLLQMITDTVIDYLAEQVLAGAQMIQVFDSWAGELAPFHFDTFCLPYLAQIAVKLRDRLHRLIPAEKIPLALFAKGAMGHNGNELKLASLGYDVLALDWSIDPESLLLQSMLLNKKQGNNLTCTALQGNLDPCCLFAPDDVIRSLVADNLAKFQSLPFGHIVNLGHGMAST